jgi:hypothetical protein
MVTTVFWKTTHEKVPTGPENHRTGGWLCSVRTGDISPDAVGLSSLPWVDNSRGACVPQWRAVGLRVRWDAPLEIWSWTLGLEKLGLGTRRTDRRNLVLQFEGLKL